MDESRQKKFSQMFQDLEDAGHRVRNTELGQSLIAKYSESLIKVGFNPHSASNLLNPVVTPILLEFFTYFSEDEERELGTKWFSGSPAQSEQGRLILQSIDSRYRDLTKVGVKPEDVQQFWDLGFLTRHDFFLQFYCLSISLETENTAAAFTDPSLKARLDRSLLRFERVSGPVSLEEDGALPLELAFRTMFLLGDADLMSSMRSQALLGESLNSQVKAALRG